MKILDMNVIKVTLVLAVGHQDIIITEMKPS